MSILLGAQMFLAALLLIAGGLALLVALIGFARGEDVYARLHALKFATTYATAPALAGLAVAAWDAALAARLALIGVLWTIAAPAIVSLIANAAHRDGAAARIGDATDPGRRA